MARPQNPPDILGAVLGTPDQVIRAQLRYDYNLIPAEQRSQVQNAAVDIVRHGKRAQESLIEIGERLIEIKAVLEHGQFSEWCETEFSFTQRTAQNMMNVAQTFGGEKRNSVSLLGDATLYLLSAPSSPEAAREQVIAEAEATGSRPTVARVKEVIAQHKPPTPTYTEVWRIESTVKGVIEQRWPDGPRSQPWISGMRSATKESGSTFMHAVEAALDGADIEFKRRDLVQAINNVAEQYEQDLRRQEATAAPPASLVAAAKPSVYNNLGDELTDQLIGIYWGKQLADIIRQTSGFSPLEMALIVSDFREQLVRRTGGFHNFTWCVVMPLGKLQVWHESFGKAFGHRDPDAIFTVDRFATMTADLARRAWQADADRAAATASSADNAGSIDGHSDASPGHTTTIGDSSGEVDLTWDLSPWQRDAGWTLTQLGRRRYRAEHPTMGVYESADIVDVSREINARLHSAETPGVTVVDGDVVRPTTQHDDAQALTTTPGEDAGNSDDHDDTDDREAAVFAAAKQDLLTAITALGRAGNRLWGWHDELANLIDELTAHVRQAVRELD